MSKTLINCLQLFWTKPSGTATLRKLKAINNNHTFSNLYLLMSPSHATSQVGLIVLHSIRSLCEDVGCAFPSGGSVDKSLQEIQKNHETSKTYQKSPLYRTKRVIKSKKKTPSTCTYVFFPSTSIFRDNPELKLAFLIICSGLVPQRASCFSGTY